MTSPAVGSWPEVEELLRTRPPGTMLRVPRRWLDHPRTFDMKASLALPVGQVADYWKRLDERTGIHVAAFKEHYLVQLQEAAAEARDSPRCDALGRGAALGALLGAALGKTERAVVMGAALGGLVAVAVAPTRRPG